jgi:hypothetical protein
MDEAPDLTPTPEESPRKTGGNRSVMGSDAIRM